MQQHLETQRLPIQALEEVSLLGECMSLSFLSQYTGSLDSINEPGFAE